MPKLNCWQYHRCGREVGGAKAKELGVCPAAMDSGHNGLNDGTKGGRICWAVAGTFCGGEVQGEYAQKIDSCMDCDFFKLVKREEHPNFKLLQPGMIYVMGPHGEHNESDRQG